MIIARVVQDGTTPELCERRRFQRMPIAIQTELRTQGNQTPIRVETADVSLGGCYVEMALTLAVGTPLNITLWLGQEKLVIEGRVVTSHPWFGNGIEFTNMSPEARDRLGCFLERPSFETGQPRASDRECRR